MLLHLAASHHSFCYAINVFTAPLATVVLTGTPLAGLTPATTLVTRAAGLPPIKTVGLPWVIDPWHAAPLTNRQPRAGKFSIIIGYTGSIGSPVAVYRINVLWKHFFSLMI
jgi:hypothetical protein